MNTVDQETAISPTTLDLSISHDEDVERRVIAIVSSTLRGYPILPTSTNLNTPDGRRAELAGALLDFLQSNYGVKHMVWDTVKSKISSTYY